MTPNAPYFLSHGRRFAEIAGINVKLLLRDNKRKPPRLVRHGEKTLTSEAECWHAALLWLRKGFIDFGDRIK